MGGREGTGDEEEREEGKRGREGREGGEIRLGAREGGREDSY